MASVYKTLAQVCLVETWQHDQQLTEGRAEAGELPDDEPGEEPP